MLDLNVLISEGSKKGHCQVIDVKNGVMKCQTVSTKKEWLMDAKAFFTRVEKKEIEIIDATTFKFKSKSLEELYKEAV